MIFLNKYLSICLIFTLITCYTSFSQSNKKFTIILDAGHGGKDPGNSYHGFKEKDIALKTTLKVGEILEKESDINIIYTRKTDVFIELANRPKIANKADANLFVSIHCNSVNNFAPSGTETFVMGLSRTDMNLEVAKSENSVIYLEKNYKETYKGFDPKKPESLLGMKLVQENNLNNSIKLASFIEDNFSNNLKRKTRGVKQQPLWVLDASYMPSVLIELGFLSNKEEGAFLNSTVGQHKMATQIANAIIKYKKEYFGDIDNNSNKKNITIVDEKPIEKEITVVKELKDVVFKVQLLASSKKISTTSNTFKGLNSVERNYENKFYKYVYGETSSYEEVKQLQQEAKNKGFSGAFVLAFYKGKSVTINEALNQL